MPYTTIGTSGAFSPVKKKTLNPFQPMASVPQVSGVKSGGMSSSPIQSYAQKVAPTQPSQQMQSQIRSVPTPAPQPRPQMQSVPPKPATSLPMASYPAKQTGPITNEALGLNRLNNTGMQSTPMQSTSRMPQPPSAGAAVEPPVPQPEDPTTAYLRSIEEQNKQAMADYEAQKAAELADADKLAGIQRQSLQSMIDNLQAQPGQLSASQAAEIADLKAIAGRQKEAAATYIGEAQRKAAQAMKETGAQNQRTFAALGTLSSRGEGSFEAATNKASQTFNEMTANLARQQADKFAAIDETVAKVERDGVSKLQELQNAIAMKVSEIQRDMAVGDIQSAQQKRQIAAGYQQKSQEISNYIKQVKFQAEQDKYNAQQEAKNLETIMAGVSDEFKTSGTPTTAGDLIFSQKFPQVAKTYADKANALMQLQQKGTTGASGQAAQQQSSENAADAVSIVDELANDPNLGGQLGMMAFRSSIPGTSEFDKGKKIERLKNLLALAARGQLKGQGTITDSETNMLKNAVAALDTGMSEQAFRAELERIKQSLLPSIQRGQQDQYSGQMMSSQAGNSSDPLGLGV